MYTKQEQLKDIEEDLQDSEEAFRDAKKELKQAEEWLEQKRLKYYQDYIKLTEFKRSLKLEN